MATTAGMTYEKAACKYCSAEISVNSLARHEADCVNASDELRESRKLARASADRRRLGKTQKKGEITQRKIECKFCHDQIGAGSIAKHEAKCETRNPRQREYAKSQRRYQSTHYDKQKKSETNRLHYQQSMRIPARTTLDEPVVPDSYQHHFTAGNGTPMKNPMAISMMVDEDDFALALGRVVIAKLPELLPQLIPGLKINDFATRHVRGPRQHKN